MCACVYECVNMCSSHTLHPPKSCRRCTSHSTPHPMPRPSPRVLLQPLLQLLLQRGILSCQFVACGGLHDCDTLVLSVSTLLQSVEGGRARESVLLVSVQSGSGRSYNHSNEFCAHVCMCVCVHACVCVYVCACVRVFAAHWLSPHLPSFSL